MSNKTLTETPVKPKKSHEKTYRVWFHQVNQTMYDVKATSKEQAAKLAEKEWYKENGPRLSDIVVMD